MPEVLAGLGIFGLVGVAAAASLFCLFQPVWALVDCIDSDRDRETKVLVSLAIVCTWGLGSLVYGLFFARSRNLRGFTVVSTLAMVAIAVLSVGSCVSAIATQARRAAERNEAREAEARRRAAEFAPAPIARDAVAPFVALHLTRTGRHTTSTALAEFDLAGPIASTARDVRGGILRVAHDAVGGRNFALTRHAFGAISAKTGEFIGIAVDPGLDFSWPKGIAWDPESERAVVLTSHVYTRLFTYDPATSSWEMLPTALRDVPAAGLACVPGESSFYALDVPLQAKELSALHRFNRAGAHVGRVALSPPVPLSDGDDAVGAQLFHSSGKLVLLLPPLDADPATGGEHSTRTERLFAIDPRTGAVYAHRSPSARLSGARGGLARGGLEATSARR